MKQIPPSTGIEKKTMRQKKLHKSVSFHYSRKKKQEISLKA